MGDHHRRQSRPASARRAGVGAASGENRSSDSGACRDVRSDAGPFSRGGACRSAAHDDAVESRPNRSPPRHDQSGDELDVGTERRRRSKDFSGARRHFSRLAPHRARRKGSGGAWRREPSLAPRDRPCRPRGKSVGHARFLRAPGGSRPNMRIRFRRASDARPPTAPCLPPFEESRASGRPARNAEGAACHSAAQRHDKRRTSTRFATWPRPAGDSRRRSSGVDVPRSCRGPRCAWASPVARNEGGRRRRDDERRRRRRRARPIGRRIASRSATSCGGRNG